MNKVILTGRIVQKPTLRELEACDACFLRVAVKNKGKSTPTFLDVATFGKLAGQCAAHLIKGQRVEIEGRLDVHDNQTKIVADEVQFGDKPKKKKKTKERGEDDVASAGEEE